MKIREITGLLILIITVLFFFYPVSILGKLPIPSDTIIGLYHPFRDFYANDYPNGIPFKNSLITDPVRQQYPWKFNSILTGKYYDLPLWNPYVMAGTPLMANFQSAVFYPLNVLLFLPDFSIWWSVLIMLQPLLAGTFMYLYLKGLRMNAFSCFLGGFVYAFCGFSIAWLEWGTIGHTALWLPVVLLSIDKLFLVVTNTGLNVNSKLKTPSNSAGRQYSKTQLKIQKFFWYFIFVFSLCFSFFAGHLQIFFYLYLLAIFYFIARWFQNGRIKNKIFLFLILNILFLILTFIQWYPTMQFILQSARGVDMIPFRQEGWFLPTKHLVQFFAPDFFGNPTTLNYWGVWNYGEFIAYIGILPLIMALYALFYRYDRKTIFFGSVFFVSLIFALPTWFAMLPFELKIPFIDTSQPTRLLFLTSFSLSVLAALGFDFFIKNTNKRKIIYPLVFILMVFIGLWVFVATASVMGLQISQENLITSMRNLYLPTLVFLLTGIFLLVLLFVKVKKWQTAVILILILITVFDLFRFGYKFTPFTSKEYLFPETLSIYLVRKLSGYSRYMTTDARIIPPNFSVMYFMQTIDGYDPLYLRRYGELIAAMERGVPDISPPFGFNRIINPHNYNSRIADLLGVKYVLSLSDLKSEKLKKIYQEGETRVYENKGVFERAFFVERVIATGNKQESIKAMFDSSVNLKRTAIVENWDKEQSKFAIGGAQVNIGQYKSNEVVIDVENKGTGFLVLTDSFYPTWHAKICSADYNNCRDTRIYLTDYNFRGVVVPSGKYKLIFYNKFL